MSFGMHAEATRRRPQHQEGSFTPQRGHVGGGGGWSMPHASAWHQLPLSDEQRRRADKECHRNVVRVCLNPEVIDELGTQGINTRCSQAGFPVLSVHKCALRPDEVLLIVRSVEDARAIRECQAGLQSALSAEKCVIYPEVFFVVPPGLSKQKLERRSAGEAASIDYHRILHRPRESLPYWRDETGLDIKRAFWKHGYLWLGLESLEQALEAVSDRRYTLSGLHTRFV